MRYFINKKEHLYIEHLSLIDKMQSIFDYFESGIEVLADRIDERTFSPIFQIRFNGAILELNVNRILIEDFSSFRYNERHIIFMDKKSIYEGSLKISSKI